jgi:prepilin-type N-terminal cleavage/methylation domain-containing protein
MMKKSLHSGFTLIEVLVSVSIFAIVMLVATGAVFSIVEANKKTHTLKSVMTNLNFALESMARDIRVGSQFSCNGGGDCYNSPGQIFAYKANRDIDGDGVSNDFIEYRLADEGIQKRVYGGSNGYTSTITANEIHIESLKFYVIGSQPTPGDTKQPKVVITIKGYSGAGNTRSDFNIQTTVSQRAIDS